MASSRARPVLGGLVLLSLAGGVAAIALASREPAAGRPTPVVDPTPTPAPSRPSGPLRAVALGDSLTLYDDLPEEGRLNNSWFAQVVRSDPAYVDAYNAGIEGDSTGLLLSRLDDDVLARDPDVVFVLGGINDIASELPTARTIDNLREIVLRIQAAGARAVLGTVPPWDELFEDDAVADPDQVLELNDAIRALGVELGVTIIDFHAATVGPDGRWLPGTSRDGLHPNADGVALMTSAAIDALSG